MRAALVHLERLGLPPCSVEGDHQLSPRPLSQRLGGDEAFQLSDQRVLASQCQLGIDPILGRREPRRFEIVALGGHERLLVQIDQRRATPERERQTQLVRCRRRVATRERFPASGHEPSRTAAGRLPIGSATSR